MTSMFAEAVFDSTGLGHMHAVQAGSKHGSCKRLGEVEVVFSKHPKLALNSNKL